MNLQTSSIKELDNHCRLYARRIILTHLPSGTYAKGIMRE